MKEKIKVKICGITNDDDAKLAVELGAHSLGFVYDTSNPIIVADRGMVSRLSERFRGQVETVAVFADAKMKDIKRAAQNDGITMIQLSGKETPEFVEKVREETGLSIIKAIHVKDSEDIKKTREYKNVLHLFDSKVPGMSGGTGKTFDWALLRDFTDPFILAGGLNTENIKEALRITGARMVDLSSGVSSSDRARKDKNLMRAFFSAIET